MGQFDIVSLRLIKNDIDDLIKIILSNKGKEYISIFSLFVTPYINLVNEESKSFFLENFIKKNDKIHFKKNAQARLRIKIFDKKYEITKSIVENIDYIQNIDFYSHLKAEFLKKMNLYYNLGTYYLNGKIIGNTHLAYHYHLPYSFEGNSTDEIKKLYQDGKIPEFDDLVSNIFECTKKIGEELALISLVIDSTKLLETNNSILNTSDIKIPYKDLNTNICFRNNSNIQISKTNNLVLLHLLCVNNFAAFLYDEIVERGNGLGIRIKYIAYDYVLKTLGQLMGDINKSTVIYQTIRESLSNVNKSILNNKFGRTMRHYGISENEIVKDLFLNHKLCGLVENYFAGMSVDEYELELTRNLYYISDMLSPIFENLRKTI